ncbi:ABC transporter ATP-binding protein [Oceanisphaera psychrotolerans]|uniref:Iron dicitrate ABC transporter ATP-binding protein n=1 Tax=Oceanisphaera psychrotolerans TaxID=1414654 RepID=A0A1J4QG16_9GAMM|nr:ABC transporter ATP-binding protein [Oceanisphaera psychrotolerans]OIN13512.1 iron dicitrate ABC transporter ATP-binding protein [Oceanisphaera psychrotolerans]
MLEIDRLSLGYGEQRIVNGISLGLDAGICALLGPNGCGKSTLLKGLAGLLTPEAGEIRLQGRPLGQWPRRELARQLAFMPQQPTAPDEIRVEQLVMLGRYPHLGLWRRPGQEDHDRVDWAMRLTGVAELASRQLRSLSGGQQQRVWIAMALAQQAALLLLDEPTTYLDWGYQLETLELLRELNSEQGLSVLMSLHELNQAARYADQLVVMREGRLICQGSPKQVLKRELIADVFGVDAIISRDEDGYHYALARGTAR